jgi:predicted metal-dependent hydrolase
MLQMRLLFSHREDTLRDFLAKMTGQSVSLTLTDNSTSMLSIRKKDGSVAVRMHRMFLTAGEAVIEEIAGFIRQRRGRTPLIRQFIRDNQTSLKNKERKCRPPILCEQGYIYHLREFFDAINREYFEGSVSAAIGWGKGNSRRAVRKRTLGTYCSTTNTIRINPVLDRRNVPNYFIRFVVYHEMLHSVVKEERKNGRRAMHTPEFRKKEKLYKDYEKAIAWEKKQR